MSPTTIIMSEWERRGPDEDVRLLGYSFGDDETVRLRARRLTESGRVEFRELRDGLFIRSNSYVGNVQLGNLRLVIQPKISGAPLLNLLRYAYNLRNLDLHGPATQAIGDSTFLDLLIHQLLVETQELIARGLHRNYERTENVLTSPRGRIDFQRYALNGGTAKAALPCIYHPRLQNTLVNRVLLSGLQLAARLTGDLILRARLRRLAALLADDVLPLRLERQVMGRVWREIDRRTAAYRPSLILIQMLIQMAGVRLDESPEQVRLPGFLFDMNRFFQAFLSRFLHENLLGHKVQDEYRLRDMMVYAEGFNPRGLESPTPRPDFVVSTRGSIVAILDAKYIDLWHHGPPASILYQLTVYALSQGLGSSTTILYPTMDASASESRLDIRHPLNQRIQAQIILRPVHLGQLEQLISHSVSHRNRQHRLGVAKYMIFGEPTGATSPIQIPQ
ncbi:MAG: hypothetical protein JSV68_04145 [Anaerolineaceae bacterium]|nr:MAG: hypothetical protein JSV68_04145 [Anaerolineaceae bacterium]